MPRESTDRRALPVPPRQARGKERFEAVLAEADRLLDEEGLEGFSIPALAERLGSTRTSIYKFFPTPYAILNELARRYLVELSKSLARSAERTSELPWPEAIGATVRAAARFHNAHPVARMLILGGPVTDDSFRATSYTIEQLGALTEAFFELKGIVLPKGHPRVAALAVEIGTAVFRVSNFHFGKVTSVYVEEATQAMVAYLRPYVAAAAHEAARKAASTA